MHDKPLRRMRLKSFERLQDQGGTSNLGTSGLEGIQNLEGSRKLHVGQRGLGQKGIFERIETGKFINS